MSSAISEGTALGDIAVVPATALKHPKGVRDVASWYMLTAMRPRQIVQGDIRIPKRRSPAKPGSDLRPPNRDTIGRACTSAAPISGRRNTLFCSPDTFDEVYAPYYSKINGWIHEHTPWKTFKHSCGAIEPIIDRLIDCGFRHPEPGPMLRRRHGSEDPQEEIRQTKSCSGAAE